MSWAEGEHQWVWNALGLYVVNSLQGSGLSLWLSRGLILSIGQKTDSCIAEKGHLSRVLPNNAHVFDHKHLGFRVSVS